MRDKSTARRLPFLTKQTASMGRVANAKHPVPVSKDGMQTFRGATSVRLRFTSTGLDGYGQFPAGKHRYPCAVMGAPIIVLAGRQGPAFGMRLQGVIRLPMGSFVLRPLPARCKTK